MPDTEPPPEPGAEESTHTPGYFNKHQLEDIQKAESVLAAARSQGETISEQDITSEYLDAFELTIQEAHTRTTNAGMKKDEAKTDTLETNAAANTLYISLQKIQSAAKQKNLMLSEDDDPATNFPVDGYLIGTRMNASRATLDQSAKTLIARATADSLPGFKTPEKIAVVQSQLDAFLATENDQQQGNLLKELSRIDRDDLIHILNVRRSAIQHAADAMWPYQIEINRPIRKTFEIPQDRPLGF